MDFWLKGLFIDKSYRLSLNLCEIKIVDFFSKIGTGFCSVNTSSWPVFFAYILCWNNEYMLGSNSLTWIQRA